MRAAIYARVSTADKQDPEMQLRELKEYCERRGWERPEIFIDRVSSGKIRPELEKMKVLCRRRRFDVVVVFRYDRFARSPLELLAALEEFRQLGIDFVSLHEGMDTTTPAGKFLFVVIAGMAEFERAIIRERVISGLANAKAQGKRLGRRPRNPDAAQIARLRAQGATWPAIAAQMGISRATAIRALVALQKPASKRLQ